MGSLGFRKEGVGFKAYIGFRVFGFGSEDGEPINGEKFEAIRATMA